MKHGMPVVRTPPFPSTLIWSSSKEDAFEDENSRKQKSFMRKSIGSNNPASAFYVLVDFLAVLGPTTT